MTEDEVIKNVTSVALAILIRKMNLPRLAPSDASPVKSYDRTEQFGVDIYLPAEDVAAGVDMLNSQNLNAAMAVLAMAVNANDHLAGRLIEWPAPAHEPPIPTAVVSRDGYWMAGRSMVEAGGQTRFRLDILVA